MSFTTDFLQSPQGFMRTHHIVIPSNVTAGNGKFQLSEQGATLAMLQTTTATPNISGYYVHPVANNINQYTLPTQSTGKYFMFTDAMTGCQFMAYGPDRQHITVEHNNFISDTSGYAKRLAIVAAQKHPYFWHLSAGNADNIQGGQYIISEGVTIVAIYNNSTGWNFYVRGRNDLSQGTVYGPM